MLSFKRFHYVIMSHDIVNHLEHANTSDLILTLTLIGFKTLISMGRISVECQSNSKKDFGTVAFYTIFLRTTGKDGKTPRRRPVDINF